MFENISQLRIDLLRDRSDLRIPDQTEHDRRLGRLDNTAPSSPSKMSTLQEERHRWTARLQCLMRQRWVARAENEVGLALDPQLLLERRLDVDLGQDTEACSGQCLADAVVTSPTETPSIRFV